MESCRSCVGVARRENAQLRAQLAETKEQLQVEQINHRQTIDRYSDDLADADDEIKRLVARVADLIAKLDKVEAKK